jgi:hypothetical protein
MLNKSSLFVLLLMGWPFLSPLVSALRQAGGVTALGDIYKIYFALCIVLALSIFFEKPYVNRKYTLWLSVLLVNACLISIINFDSINSKYWVSQFFSFLSLSLFISVFNSKHAVKFKLFTGKLVWVNIAWNAILLVLFGNGFFGDPGYPNFDVSGLFLTYVYCLMYGSPVALVAHLLVFLLSEKRALFAVALFLYIVFKFGILHVTSKRPNLALFLSLFIAAIIGFQFVVVAQLGQLDSSTLERLSEIFSAYDQLMVDAYSNFVGRGFGWSYSLIGFETNYEEHELRGFMHFSPAYFHVTYGLFGIIFLLIIIRKLLGLFNMQADEIKLLGLYALAMVVIGMTRLNYFTEPLFMLAIGMVLKSKNKFALRKSLGV